ncbi:hypothetical protein BHE74_00048068 [Ensete ventricosum]|nr:hypothetical protein GW17_00053298 [Ensete ventricosum]RWW46052.1 hypothetical protein BHE74_00048068 [Ensete ventricosum]RZS25480.1 hypothetical protein BHM03_00058717 [Ensete ventricosum]
MSWSVVNDGDGLPRIILTEPAGASAVVRYHPSSSSASSYSFLFLNGFFVCSEIRVEGLEMLDYFDNLENGERFTEQGDALTFDGEVPLVVSSSCSHICIM